MARAARGKTWRAVILLAGALGCAGRDVRPAVRSPVRSAGPEPIRIAFGSCLDEERPHPILAAVVASDPEAFVFIGDNVYADVGEARGRDAYARLEASPEFIRLRAATRLLAVWDDHDYGLNDGDARHAGKHEAKQMLLEFFADPPDSPRREREGVYDAWMLTPSGRGGPRIQIIALDTRWFRSPWLGQPGRYRPSEGERATMLGAAQWAWLARELRRPADLRLLVSSIQVLPPGDGYESWSLMPHERRRLLELVARSDGTTVLLSGDRHRAELSRTLVSQRAVLELTSSSLNRPSQDPADNPYRLGPLLKQANFGVVTLHRGSKPRVCLEIRGEVGQRLLEHCERTRALLRPRP